MNQPAYQDWGRYQTPSANSMVTDSQGPLTSYIGPRFDCSSWAYVSGVVVNHDTVVTVDFQVLWTSYTPNFVSQQNDHVAIGPQGFATFCMPTRDRQIQTAYFVNSGVPTLGVDYTLFGVSHYISKYDMAQFKFPLIGAAQVIPGPGNVVFTTGYWYEGLADLSVVSAAGTAGNANLEYFDVGTNSWQEFLHIGIKSDVNSVPFVVSLPPFPVRIKVFNQGAAADTFRVHMRPRPE